MEGITGYIYRNAQHTYISGPDKYYSPFISATQNQNLRAKEINDILPENNRVTLVPQLLTNKAEDFIQTSRLIKELGYQEINLNLGCPSGTVVSKSKGAGFLAKTETLDLFLEEIFTASVTKISVKTRIGIDNPEEFYKLIELYNQYPITELIIHPRLQKDFYKNKPNLHIFREAIRLSKNPLCYNGNIFTAEDYIKFQEDFPEISTIMLGRGLLANPGLIEYLQGRDFPEKARIKEFHDKLYQDYQKVMYGDRNVLFKMKELWYYLIMPVFNPEKYAKKIKKAERFRDYEEAVESLFREQEYTVRQISF
jgi:tRNA-dihydrouridine synthase